MHSYSYRQLITMDTNDVNEIAKKYNMTFEYWNEFNPEKLWEDFCYRLSEEIKNGNKCKNAILKIVMPENCRKCQFAYNSPFGWTHCGVNNMRCYKTPDENRDADCPLSEDNEND